MTLRSDDPALVIKHLSKDFIVPNEKKNTLKERMLHFNKPSLKYFHALQDINFEVKRGEFFGIVGRNGSGKSTLLKIIGGIYQPTKGILQVNGTLTPFIELGIGFNPELTGRENVYLNGAILGLTRKEISNKYNEIVAFSELEHFMEQKLKNYSSGMQVRLAFAIAIQAHNDILLIDEVLAVGDASFQRKCYQVFNEIKNSGKTIIFVTHDMGAVQEFCDRALMIQDSRISAIGNPREIALRYELANSSAGAGMDSEDKLLRPKNPAVKIIDLRVRNDEKIARRFSLKDNITIDITIDVAISKIIQVNLFLVGSNGEYYAGVNSNNDLSFNYKPKVGRHTLRCNVPARQLLKDEYSIGVGVYEQGDAPELIDIIDRAYTTDAPKISLTESSIYQDGKFYMEGAWSLIDN